MRVQKGSIEKRVKKKRKFMMKDDLMKLKLGYPLKLDHKANEGE